jgi:hypothetical protein
MSRLATAWAVRSMAKAGKARRGRVGQLGRRQAERAIRKSALAFGRWSAWCGLASSRTAAMLDLAPSTLANWRRDWRSGRMKIELRGRPASHVDPVTRLNILAIFHLMGPGVGLNTLRAFFPQAARGELEDLLARFRRIWKRGSHALIYALKWLLPGTVWAMDWLEAPRPIDGIYRYVLTVRDLAAGRTLLALPSVNKAARTAAEALLALFLECGAPLVLKSDNEFGQAQEVREALGKNSVLHLLSPPGLPEYNGACEAGIGGLKTRTHYQAARNDRPGEWTCDDVLAGAESANQTHRPNGYAEPTPDQTWATRQPISQETRQAFIQTVRNLETEARQELGFLPGIDLDHYDQAAVNRLAIGRACVASGLLQIRRRRFSPQITQRIASKIS